ncbi:hypothetical protein JL720_1288 [Aureococcus anophagefferens]|nr:hypothetical protein JL720_1288 [Aureococcus anophagefferens]
MTDSPLRESKTWEPNSSERWSDSTPTLPSPLRRVNSQSMDGDASLDAHTLGQFGVLRAGYLHTGASRWERTDAALGGSQKLRFVVLAPGRDVENEEIRVGEVKTDETLTLVCGDGDLDIDPAVPRRSASAGVRRALLGPAAKPVRVKRRRKVDPGDARAVRDASARTGAPGKFIVGTGGDVREASRRWAETSRWRRERDVDAVMGEAHPKFAAIKRHYPHYWCGRGRRGELIYVERVGHVDAAGLKRDGVTIDHLVRHYILLHEFTWSVLAPAPDGPTSYQCVVLDVDGVQLSQCRGIRFDYVRRCAAIAKEHYPERCSRMVIANAPQWFSVVWKMRPRAPAPGEARKA